MTVWGVAGLAAVDPNGIPLMEEGVFSVIGWVTTWSGDIRSRQEP